jgi:hypothetical protein
METPPHSPPPLLTATTAVWNRTSHTFDICPLSIIFICSSPIFVLRALPPAFAFIHSTLHPFLSRFHSSHARVRIRPTFVHHSLSSVILVLRSSPVRILHCLLSDAIALIHRPRLSFSAVGTYGSPLKPKCQFCSKQ